MEKLTRIDEIHISSRKSLHTRSEKIYNRTNRQQDKQVEENHLEHRNTMNDQ
jgi:hypothetical protein